MRLFIDTLGGIGEIIRLGLRSGMRLRSPYWRWRVETAFGSDPTCRPGLFARMKAMLAYGRWVYRMKRLR